MRLFCRIGLKTFHPSDNANRQKSIWWKDPLMTLKQILSYSSKWKSVCFFAFLDEGVAFIHIDESTPNLRNLFRRFLSISST